MLLGWAPWAVGLLLTAAGLVLGGLVWGFVLFAAQASRRGGLRLPAAPVTLPPQGPAPSPQEEHATEGLMVVRPGGRVVYLNATLRRWLGLEPTERPPLETLARRIRPRETFLRLCAAPGQARLMLAHRWLEVASYPLPTVDGQATVLVFRLPALMAEEAGPEGAPNATAKILAELARSFNRTLELEATVRAVLRAVDRLVPNTYLEMLLWDEEAGSFRACRFVGTPGLDDRIERHTLRRAPDQGRKLLLEHRRPLLIPDVNQPPPGVVPPVLPKGLRAYLGLPLVVEDTVIGLLEVASDEPNAFGEQERYLLQMVAEQAALALRNARTFTRAREQVGLLERLVALARRLNRVQEAETFVRGLVEGMREILPAEMVGLLLYDEGAEVLEAQWPFIGVPRPFVEAYRVHLASEGLAAWFALREPLVLPQAAEAPLFRQLGLADLARGAGMQATLLIPLRAEERVLGAIQLSNRPEGHFEAADLQLARLIAQQIAPAVENFVLLQQSRERARRAEGLRRIANLVASEATLDEILRFVLLEVSQLLQASSAAVFLLDEEQEVLEIHRPSAFRVSPETMDRLGRLSVHDPLFRETVTRMQRPFLSADIQTDTRISAAYRPIVEAFPNLHSAIVVPLMLRDRSFGEMLIGHARPHAYQRSDVQLALSVAGQMALALERQRLWRQSDVTLVQQADQMRALLRLSRELTLAPSLQALIRHFRADVVRLTGAACASVKIFTEGEQPALHWLCTPEQPPQLTERERQALRDARPVLFDPLPTEDQPHPGVRSALTVPLLYQDQPVGVLDLHSGETGFFDEQRMRFARSLGLQAALAIGIHLEREAQLRTIARLKHRQQALQLTHEFFATHHLSEEPYDLLLEMGRVLVRGVEGRRWGLYAYEASTGLLRPVVTPEEESPPPLTWDRVVVWLQGRDEERYIFRLSGQAAAEARRLLWRVEEVEDQEEEDEVWAALVRSPRRDLLGLVLFSRPASAQDAEVEESLGLLLPTLGVLFQWWQVRQLHALQVQDLEARTLQAQTALYAAQEGITRWLRKDLEQMLDIHALARGKERLETSLEIATEVNRQPERQAVFDALGHQLLERLAMEVAILVDRVGDRVRLRQVYGVVPPNVHLDSLLGQHNPLYEVMETRRAILIGDLEQEDTPWRDSPLLRRLQARSVLVIPIGTEANVEAAVLTTARSSMPPFSPEDVQAFTLLGHQVGIALQNLNLLHETSRRLQEVDSLLAFSRMLGELDPERLLNSLLESALTVVRSAHAGFVALWDPRREALVIKAAQGYGEPQLILGIELPPRGLPGACFSGLQPQRVDEVNFVEAYPLDQEGLLRYQQATLDRLPISALAIPIAAREHPLGVLVLENFNTAGAFGESDENLLLALAQQTGLMLENARLLQDAQARASQLQALANVAAIITSTLQSEEVLSALLPQLTTAVPFDAATLWLREGETFVVRDASGFPDNEERKGLQVAIEDSALLNVIVATQDPLVIPDIQEDETFPWPEGYPYRSWLGLPLLSQGEVIGLIVLEKKEPRFFTPEWVEVGRTFAAQAAAALQNARLYEESVEQAAELRERTTRLELVYSFTAELSASLDPDYILRLTARRLREALGVGVVAMIRTTEEGLRLAAVEPPTAEESWPQTWPPLELLQQMAESRGVVIATDPLDDPRFAPWQEHLRPHHPGGLVLFPLMTREVLHGVALAVLEPGQTLSSAALELGRSLAQQAAVAYQNAQLYAEMRSLTEDLERRVAERTQELTREHQRAQLLLRIITELASSLDLDQVLNRTLDLMNRSLGAEQSTILLYRPGEKTFFLRAARGYAGSPPPGGRPTALPVKGSLAGWVVARREPVLVPDLRHEPRWQALGEEEQGHRSAIMVPLQVGEDVLGVFALFHRQPGYFSPEHLDLAVAAARQVAVAINNAELFNLIRDQSERLGKEVRQREVEASRARAILESVADGILVTDAKGKVTLFNASAERLLGIPEDHILGQPLERFSGIFGAAAGEWLATVRRWSADPSSYRPGEVYEQRLDLDDGRVLSVRLTPVLTPREFLGTVSVFRDITHQVEVDRLKSEFVATVSHELRTPMTAIKGYVELLLKGAVGALNPQQQRFLEIVQSNTERLSTLVNDLLDISRIEAGKIIFAPQAVRLAEIVEEVLQEARRVAEKEGRTMTFHSEVPEDLPPVWGDPERIRQILENLVSNGYRYTPDGGEVVVRARVVDDEVQVAVSDNGIGIPPSEQEHVFDRFYRGEHPLVMASAGTGLGLSIVRHLVEMHRGRIWVESTGVPGEGSTFTFTLPLYTAVAQEEGGEDG